MIQKQHFEREDIRHGEYPDQRHSGVMEITETSGRLATEL